MTASEGKESWVLLLLRDDEATLYEAAAMTASATSLGISITLVWFDVALEALVSGRLEDAGARPASAHELLASARETGRLRSLACSASAVGRRGEIEKVRASVDDIVGWPTLVSLIRAADETFVW